MLKQNNPSQIIHKYVLVSLLLLTAGLVTAAGNVYAQEPAAERFILAQDASSEQETDFNDDAITPAQKTNTGKTSEIDKAWEAFVPPQDEYDWIQLNSGEWLKGELKVLYDHTLEFDSDELDLLKLDIEDVANVRSHGVKGVRLEGPITVYGRLEMTKDKVIIDTGDSVKVYKRSMLVAIAQGDDNESNYWTARMSLGMNFTAGNTEQVDYSAIVNVKRRTSANRFVMDYLGNYSKTRSITTVENHRLNGYVDMFRTRRFYIRPVFAEYWTDTFQNIQYRATVGAGVGYHLINTKKTEWDVTPGFAYQVTRFVSVEPDEEIKVSTPTFVLGTKYDTEINKKMDFKFNYSLNLVDQESGTYTHHMITTLETEITKWLDFDISFVWDRIKDPTANADGTIPKSDDFQLIFGLGIDY